MDIFYLHILYTFCNTFFYTCDPHLTDTVFTSIYMNIIWHFILFKRGVHTFRYPIPTQHENLKYTNGINISSADDHRKLFMAVGHVRQTELGGKRAFWGHLFVLVSICYPRFVKFSCVILLMRASDGYIPVGAGVFSTTNIVLALVSAGVRSFLVMVFLATITIQNFSSGPVYKLFGYF